MLEFIGGALVGGMMSGGNRTVVNQRSGSSMPDTINITHHEHRAPTDESVKLLAEMQEKSADSVIHRLLFKVNEIEGAIIFYHEEWSMTIAAKIAANINNKEFIHTVQLHPHDMFSDGKPNMLKVEKILIEALSKHIAETILAPHNWDMYSLIDAMKGAR